MTTTQVYTEEEQKARYAATRAEAQQLLNTNDTEDTRKFECPYDPKTADALKWALHVMGLKVRLNDRSHQAEWQQGEWTTDPDLEYADDEDEDDEDSKRVWQMKEWEPLTDEAKRYLRDQMLKEVNVRFGRDNLEDALGATLFHLHTDPLLEYFRSLPKPDGRNILHKALAQCMKVDPEYKELAEWASTYLFLGVVWRTFEPGTKLDEIPVLTGSGGIGKSTFPAMAVPQDIPNLYGSGLDLGSTPQRQVESILGKAIVEISEMVGAGHGDMNKIKDFISRTNDYGVRLVYAHNTEPLPRRCIMLGTSDKDQFLPPDENHRRFVPIRLERGDARKVRSYLTKNRDRLWGEAVGLYRNNVKAHLPDNLKGLAEKMVKRAQWERKKDGTPAKPL